MLEWGKGVSYSRASRPDTANIYSKADVFQIGKCKIVKQSPHDQALVISGGVTLYECLEAVSKLEVDVRVIDLFSVKPVDKKELVKSLGECNNKVLVVEDHFETGGLGDAVRRALMGHRCTFKHHFVGGDLMGGTPKDLYKHSKLDADSLTLLINQLLQDN